MGDLFDIANLITSVGVDAVKIKPEPGLPEKSSNEILTELFSTFDVDEGIVSPENDEPTFDVKKKSEKKKKKKKHKHKNKKHKKKSKHNSTDSSDAESVGIKKKHKHKKKSKRKHENDSNKSSDSEGSGSKIRRLSGETIKSVPNTLKDDFDILGKDDNKFETPIIKQVPDYDKSTSKSKKEEDGNTTPTLPPISKKVKDDNEVPMVPLLLEKTKTSVHGKIMIKDLKNSVVYNETVKEIENKEREKAAKMEDGEISDSSEDERTPTLSPSPPHDSKIKSPIPSTSLDRSKKKSQSPTSCKKIKNDLRQILKEKEKKRKESKSKDEKNIKSHKSHRNSKIDSKRSSSCQSRDKKRSSSPQRSYRSRSRDRDKRRGRSRERRERWSHDRWEEDRSRDRRHYSRHRSRSRERKEWIEIDKKKLLEIARRNAINMIKRGALPIAQRDKAIAAIQAGGKTVDELTDFCKSLSKSEAMGELSSISSEDDGSGSEKGFHHPFLLKERPNSIIMNIRDAKQLPTKTFQEKTAESSNQLRLQFPVSSGQLHRKTESEWVPVPPKKPEPQKKFIPASEPLCSLPPASVPAPVSTLIPTTTPVAVSVQVPIPVPVPISVQQPSIFPQPSPAENMDIGSIVSQRLAAMRKLRENPNDVCALNEMYRAQNEMKSWAESKQMPGQFTGSTGVKVLTPAELTSGYQAWARKDQLTSAQPVSGGMGMTLLQKMGWRPGEGLGKNKEGTLEPLQLEVKLDKKGLVSEQDVGKKVGKAIKPVVPTTKTLEGKHPVSLLGEYCSKRKLGVPIYELCFECGPDHKKNFLFKVKVNGIEYKPSVASPNKKQAKAEAAQICLQTIGLLPS